MALDTLLPVSDDSRPLQVRRRPLAGRHRHLGTPRPTRRPTPPSGSEPLPPLALATVLGGVFLAMVDFFIVNVALPTMALDLRASDAVLELVVAGYATAYAVLLVVGGRLGDSYGRRRMFQIGLVGFTLTSLLCGLAPTAATLVLARILQGATAALLVPQTLSTIQATGTAVSRARAVGWFGATGGVAAVVGQVFGGMLVSADIAGAGWRPIFLVNVPIGVAALTLARRAVPETRSPRATRPDFAGTALLAAAVVALLVPLTEGRALGWPLWSIALIASAPVWALGFVALERRLEARGVLPLVPPSVMRHRSMRLGLLLVAPFFAGFGTFMFVYALIAQGRLGYSPLEAGLGLAPMAAVFLIASLLTSRLVTRYGRSVITAGALLQLTGLVLLIGSLDAVWPGVGFLAITPALLIMGFGQGLVMPSLIRVLLSEVPVAEAGVGSGVFTTTQQIALALGVASLGTLFVTLSPASRLGALHAGMIILGVQSVIAVGIATASRRLGRVAA